MEILIQACQLILSLSILVLLHELGHFIPAKLFKTRVEKFYLFFDPWFSVFKKKVGDTEYGLGWLPLGGYVKISGMIDESMDKEQMKKPAEPWEFRAKPAWQRLIIMAGGVFVNLVLGVLIYSMVLAVWGDSYISNEKLVNGVSCSGFAKSLGFEDGDRIINVDGKKIERYSEIQEAMLLNDDPYVVEVLRGGEVKTVNIEASLIKKWKDGPKSLFFTPAEKTFVEKVLKNSNAEKAGVKKGDLIVSINEIETPYFLNVVEELKKNKSKKVVLNVIRNNSPYSLVVRVDKDGKIGFLKKNTLEVSYKKYDLLSSIPAGYNLAVDRLSSYISQFALIFNSDNELASELGGFGAIGSMFPESWNWLQFWKNTAFLSLMLAFMNLLPIPALDGGHIAFLFYEIIVGKPAPEKFVENAQIVGMVLLFSLLIFANGNDILRLF